MNVSLLGELHALPLSKATVTLWVVHYNLNGRTREASYSVLRVNAEEELRSRLREAVATKVSGCNQIEDFTHTTIDQDETAYRIDAAQTDFPKILLSLNLGSDAPVVESESQLEGAWGYIVQLNLDGGVLYAFRHLNNQWKIKRIRPSIYTLFRDNQLYTIEDKNIFTFDCIIDFIEYKDRVLILNKINFEKSMNYRGNLKLIRDETFNHIRKGSLITGLDILESRILDKKNMMRRLADIRSRGYFEDPQYMSLLKKTNESEGWNLYFDGDKLCITEDTVDIVMTLLGNDRLKSLVNEEIFDIRGQKKAVERRPKA